MQHLINIMLSVKNMKEKVMKQEEDILRVASARVRQNIKLQQLCDMAYAQTWTAVPKIIQRTIAKLSEKQTSLF
jgi:hypothetical protein